MTDVFSPKKRSEIMGKIKGKDTKPELLVRSILHRNGFRFRANQGKLPGNPDIILAKYRKVIFVHGCFWHGHKHCLRAAPPSTNKAFWKKKIEGNIARDVKNRIELRRLKWKSLIVWTCRIKNEAKLESKLLSFLSLDKGRL